MKLKAKNTVMKPDMPLSNPLVQGAIDRALLRQAEISFKAGIEAMVDLLKTYYNFALECEEIKAQLKEWDIK